MEPHQTLLAQIKIIRNCFIVSNGCKIIRNMRTQTFGTLWAVLGFFKPAKTGRLVDGVLLFRHGRHHIVTLPAIDNLPVWHREPEKLFDLPEIVAICF